MIEKPVIGKGGRRPGRQNVLGGVSFGTCLLWHRDFSEGESPSPRGGIGGISIILVAVG
jgi:hypothetical protein